jgi:hypothetical protein
MNTNTILAVEISKLHQTLERHKRKRRQQRQYIASGGALQAKEGQRLAAEANRVVVKSELAAAALRQRALLTCSNCYEQGHKRN